MQEAEKIAENLLTPLGALTVMIMALGALYRAIMKGDLRLGREVTSLEALLLAEQARTRLERERGDRWLEAYLSQSHKTDRMIDVAKTATTAITSGAQQP